MQEAEHHGDRWFKDAAEQATRRERINDLTRLLTAASKAAGTPLGETGDFPLGAMTPDDEGQIRMGITAEHGKVIIAFGKPIAWIGLSPKEARNMARMLGECADRA